MLIAGLIAGYYVNTSILQNLTTPLLILLLLPIMVVIEYKYAAVQSDPHCADPSAGSVVLPGTIWIVPYAWRVVSQLCRPGFFCLQHHPEKYFTGAGHQYQSVTGKRINCNSPHFPDIYYSATDSTRICRNSKENQKNRRLRTDLTICKQEKHFNGFYS